MKNTKLILIGLVALLIGGGVGFFGGMKFQQSKTPTRQFTLNGNANFIRGNGMGRGANGMAVRGQVIKADNNSITVKLTDGSTKIVILGSSTTIAKTTTGSASDLADGVEVTAFGTTNSDGSVTATNVQVGNVGLFGNRPSGSPMPQ